MKDRSDNEEQRQLDSAEAVADSETRLTLDQLTLRETELVRTRDRLLARWKTHSDDKTVVHELVQTRDELARVRRDALRVAGRMSDLHAKLVAERQETDREHEAALVERVTAIQADELHEVRRNARDAVQHVLADKPAPGRPTLGHLRARNADVTEQDQLAVRRWRRQHVSAERILALVQSTVMRDVGDELSDEAETGLVHAVEFELQRFLDHMAGDDDEVAP